MIRNELIPAKKLIDQRNFREAKPLLLRIIYQDPAAELAYIYLAGIEQRTDLQRVYLMKAVEINPKNVIARQGLELLNRQKKKSWEKYLHNPCTNYSAKFYWIVIAQMIL